MRVVCETEKGEKPSELRVTPDKLNERFPPFDQTPKTQSDKTPKTKSKGSVVFAEGFVPPTGRKRVSVEPAMTKLSLAQTAADDSSFNKSGLSGVNITRSKLKETRGKLLNKNVSINEKSIVKKEVPVEERTKLRRTAPFETIDSEHVGRSVKFGHQQLQRKAVRHLKDYGFGGPRPPSPQNAMLYFQSIQKFLKKPNLKIYPNATFNKQENVFVIMDLESRMMVGFEKNTKSEEYFFITSYKVKEDEAFTTFLATYNIGLSPEERKARAEEIQKNQSAIQKAEYKARKEKEKENAFRRGILDDARISNKDAREVELLKQAIELNPDYKLTPQQEIKVERYDKLMKYKEEYKQKEDRYKNDIAKNIKFDKGRFDFNVFNDMFHDGL